MKSKSKKNFVVTGTLFLLFILFTIIVMKIDVKPIGPQQSLIGLASLNKFIFELFGINLIWYDITDYLGLVAIFIAFGFALIGLCQLIKRKSLLKIDSCILLLGFYYIVVIIVYIFFELNVVNYRPIILQANLEASYPSSHAIIVISILGPAMLLSKRYLRDRKVILINSILAMIMVLTIVGRLISGIHWFTDIIGGIILSSALIMMYYSVMTFIEEKKAI